MCFGGGGSPAVITMPDTRAYDRQAQLQMDAMRQTQEMGATIKQGELNKALAAQQQTLADLRDAKVQRANETAANASRMAALIGAPPPEPTAKAPTIGSDREAMARSRGKKGLRIDRATPASTAAGTGLNITTA